MYPNTIFPEIYKPKSLITPILSLAFRKSKTSDFFDTKYGGFAPKVRRFLSKKSDVFVFRFPPPRKKFGSASIWVIIPVPFHVGIENFCP